MSLKVADRVRETSVTTGTGALVLAGAITGGYQAFSAVCADGDTVYYSISDPAGAKWEVGLGIWNTGNLLTRSAPGVLAGSSGASTLVSFAVGTKDVMLVVPAVRVLAVVVGPSSSTDKAVPRFNGITGALVQDTGVIISDANVMSAVGLLLSGLTASRLLVTDGSKNLASHGALTTGKIPKVAASGASLAESLLSDDGVNVALASGQLQIPADGGIAIGANGGIISQQSAGTPDQAGLWVGSLGNCWIIAESADKAFDFAHALQADPTLFIHSRNQSTSQWLSLTHDGTDGVIGIGTTYLRLPQYIKAGTADNSGINFVPGGFTTTYAGFIRRGADVVLEMESSGATGFSYNSYQTPDTLFLGLGALANSLIIAENADRAFDFAHALQVDPTLFIHSHNQSLTQWLGLSHNGAQPVLSSGLGPVALPGGAVVASATALPLPTGNVFHVSGTTTITSITSTGIVAGTIIVLIFNGTLTVNHGNNLKLKGGANFSATADAVLALAYDGTNWYQSN